MQLAVVDGMGGGIGGQIVALARRGLPETVEIIALGTNAAATQVMMKAGANRGATGENAICFAVQYADIVVGPLGIVIPHSMLGEISPAMAAAVFASRAKKFLVPVPQPHAELIGVDPRPLSSLMRELVNRILAETTRKE